MSKGNALHIIMEARSRDKSRGMVKNQGADKQPMPQNQHSNVEDPISVKNLLNLALSNAKGTKRPKRAVRK